jgi:hypothetical protein
LHLGPVKVEEFLGATLLNAINDSVIAQCAFAHHAFHHAVIVEHFEHDYTEYRLVEMMVRV